MSFLRISILALLVVGCRPTAEDFNQSGDSDLHFIEFGGSGGCTLNYARERVLNICIKGPAANGTNLSKAQDYSKRAVLTWFRALKQIDDQVTDEVAFSCSSPHLTINLVPGSGTSFASCGKTIVYVERPYGTYLHEFGHAVAALGDTYTGRQAGACKAGQPKSVMCWGAYGPNKDPQGFNLLYDDDVNGIQTVYKKIHPSMTPPSFNIDPLAAIDPASPWPSSGGGDNVPPDSPNPGDNSNNDTPLGKDLFGALAESDASHLFVSARINLDQVFICEGTTDKSCLTTGGGVEAKFLKRVGDRKIFMSEEPVNFAPDQSYTVFAGGTIDGSFQPSDKMTMKIQAK